MNVLFEPRVIAPLLIYILLCTLLYWFYKWNTERLEDD